MELNKNIMEFIAVDLQPFSMVENIGFQRLIQNLMNNGAQRNGNEMRIIGNNVEWKPQLNAMLRYGGWMTTIQEFWVNGHGSIVGMPKNFVEELLFHLTNSR
jgi:hypothetical protein